MILVRIKLRLTTMCKRDKPERKHTILSMVGLIFSFIELIVASVYNP